MGAAKTAAALARHDATLEARAATLAVTPFGGDAANDVYVVASATTAGRFYTVEYDRAAARWACTCQGSAGGAMCAHRRAARRYRARRGLAVRGGAT